MTGINSEKQNSFSFRWGGTGSDIKIYFIDALDLDIQLKELGEKAVSIKTKICEFKEKLIGSG